jgi:hypothetical protein
MGKPEWMIYRDAVQRRAESIANRYPHLKN